jgi:hypothetical protein
MPAPSFACGTMRPFGCGGSLDLSGDVPGWPPLPSARLRSDRRKHRPRGAGAVAVDRGAGRRRSFGPKVVRVPAAQASRVSCTLPAHPGAAQSSVRDVKTFAAERRRLVIARTRRRVHLRAGPVPHPYAQHRPACPAATARASRSTATISDGFRPQASRNRRASGPRSSARVSSICSVCGGSDPGLAVADITQAAASSAIVPHAATRSIRCSALGLDPSALSSCSSRALPSRPSPVPARERGSGSAGALDTSRSVGSHGKRVSGFGRPAAARRGRRSLPPRLTCGARGG